MSSRDAARYRSVWGSHDARGPPQILGTLQKGLHVRQLISCESGAASKDLFSFSTMYDNQTTILVRAYEGVRALTKENNFIGEFQLSGIPPAPRGTPQIEITIGIDEDFLTTVTASHGGRRVRSLLSKCRTAC
jgi:molecular chaperone DnaK (HSP70)